jgi:hypothetical protein
MKTLAGLISSLALASCVSAPPGTPDVSGMQMELRGHPLDAGDVVILHASNQWAAKQQLAAADADKAQPGHSIEPAADLELLRKSFVAGFSAVKSASPVSSEEKLAAACFSGAGLAEREPWAQPIQPDFSAPACRAALASARARYLVSVHGWLTTDSLTDVEVIGIGAGVTTELRYHFEVAAMVFDVRTGNAICGDQGWWEAKGVRGAGVFVTPYPFPVPIPLLWIETVDAKAYWEQAAWYAGARTAACFVAPQVDVPAGDPSGQARAQRSIGTVVPNPYAWPVEPAPPIVVRITPLDFVPPHVDPPRAHEGRVDCTGTWGAGLASSLPALRRELEERAAATPFEEALRVALAADNVSVQTARWAASAQGRLEDLRTIGANASKIVVADVHIRFGQVNRVRCAVKLVASAEVRVQPLERPEAVAPLFDAWAALDDVPVEDWARRPGAARDALDGLLRQVAVDLAKTYRQRTFGN